MNYGDMKLIELKTELKTRGLKMIGNKKELIERLEENDTTINNETNTKKKEVIKKSKDIENALDDEINTKKKQIVKKTIKKQKDSDVDDKPKKDTRTTLEKKLDKLLEKEEKDAQKEKDNRDKSLLELLFKTLTGNWYTIFIKDTTTLKELRDEVAKKINTDKFRLHQMTNLNDQNVGAGDIMFPNGNVHRLLSDDDNEKQLNELGIINETMFSITIRLI